MATNKTALVTGSGRNIGRAVALELAALGCNVIVNGSSDRQACESVAGEIEATGARALVAMGDIGEREQALAMAEAGIQQFGGIDILVNNAAIRPSFDLLNDSEDAFAHIMNTNFYSTLWLTRACLPGMIERHWGRVINFTGMNAQQGYSGKSAVSVSKHACWALTKAIAKDYGKDGITANIISPGTIRGEVPEPAFADRYETLQEQNPVRRLGEPNDIAKAVSYLVGEHSGFVNGQLLQINGGVVV